MQENCKKKKNHQTEPKKWIYQSFNRRYFTADEVEELTEGWEFVALRGCNEVYRKLNEKFKNGEE